MSELQLVRSHLGSKRQPVRFTPLLVAGHARLLDAETVKERMALLVRTVGRIQQPRACAHWELGPQWQVALLAGKHARDATVTEKPKQARSWGRHAHAQ